PSECWSRSSGSDQALLALLSRGQEEERWHRKQSNLSAARFGRCSQTSRTGRVFLPPNLFSTSLMLVRWQFPLFIEEARRRHLARQSRRRRRAHVDHREIRKLRHLSRIIEIVILAESEAAVEHHVTLRIERVGIDQERHMMLG